MFYGAGMIMTGALHAHRRFAMAAIAPILNNLVVIGVYVVYAMFRGDDPPTVDGITTTQTLVLGLGTTLGVVAMTVCLIPQLRSLGWHFRFRWAPRHPAVRKAAHLGVWALGYAGGYQAGLIVVLMLANGVEGGVAAYQWAYTFFYMPHALFAVAIFHVLFPAMSEDAARGEPEELLKRLRDGLRMLAFILLPTAAIMFAGAGAISKLTLEYGVMTEAGAELIGRVLAAFIVGLPTYSTFLVATRAYYAMSDTKTPALVNAGAVVISSVLGVILFSAASSEWSVPGLALAHSVAFAVAAVVLVHLLSRRLGTVATRDLKVSIGRSLAASLLTLAVAGAITVALPEATKVEALVSLTVASGAGLGLYVADHGDDRRTRAKTFRRARQTERNAVSRRLNVLQVLGRSAGGIARHVAQITEALDDDELAVDVAGPTDLPVRMPKAVIPLDIPDGPRGHSQVVRRLRSYVKQGDYDVLHAHGLRAGIDAALAGRPLEIPALADGPQPRASGRLGARQGGRLQMGRAAVRARSPSTPSPCRMR